MNDGLKERLRPLFQGCMLGSAIGDAFGMPVETMTHEEIMVATNGRGITDYVAPIQTKFKDMRDFKAGMWTDDTQLTIAVAKSLIEKRKLDMISQGEWHIVAFNEAQIGWGKTTRNSIKEIKYNLRHAEQPAENNGCGNGVAMKIAPLALFYMAKYLQKDNYYWKSSFIDILMEDVIRLGKMTHGDIRASIAAVLVAYFIIYSINSTLDNDGDWRDWLDDQFLKILEKEEAELINSGQGIDLSFFEAFKYGKVMDIILGSYIDGQAFLNTRNKFGGPFFAVESILTVILMAEHSGHMKDEEIFENLVLKTVNFGGDADSNAAMVGAIIGARVGINNIPAHWIENLYRRDDIIKIADDLLDAVFE